VDLAFSIYATLRTRIIIRLKASAHKAGIASGGAGHRLNLDLIKRESRFIYMVSIEE
jgi:hypothetical protein